MRFLNLCIGFLCMVAVISCSSRKVTYKSENYEVWDSSSAKMSKSAKSVLKEAHKFEGAPYKYGGTTRSGLDCSGLVVNAFDAAGINMPRISRDQAERGKQINLKKVKAGDLLFFITSGSKINHVGIVDKVKNGEVFFIHASTSKGVIVSSLNETYWNKRFVKATRVL